MRSKKKLAVMAVITVIVLLVAVPAVYGVQPDNAGVLYSTYLDWLQGKPVGLAQVNSILPHNVEKAMLVVVDYTSGDPEVLYKGPFMSPMVKIERIPVGTKLKAVIRDGRVSQITVTKYKPVQLLVIVSAREYWGAKFIEFTPDKPLTRVNVRMPLYRDGVGESIKNLGKGFQVTINSIGTMYMDVKILRLHSVLGATEEIDIDHEASLALDSFSQSVSQFGGEPSPTGWECTGAVTTPFEYLAPVPTSNGEMKTVYGHVRYNVELTTVCGYLICRNIYILHPEGIEYFSKIQTGRDPGTIPWNLDKRIHWRSAGNEFKVYFDRSSNDGGVYLSTSVSVCFGEVATVCFSGTVDSYRKTSGSKPVIKVLINSWHGGRLYFAPYSSRGNYYEVYLQWG
ncbi:hypothetical protein [Thermococcus sp.]|uniref:hypothetical protein n=1 Tax=Thermococcus sp. TaxID=35749 RepID=UPI002629FC4C|nr:hypothetical protein [Thermococcus sp.]